MPRLCVVFDLDDTLYLEHEYVLSGFAAVGEWAERTLGHAGLGQRAAELYAAGAGNRTLQQALLAIGGEPEGEVLAAMLNVYRTHTPNISLPADSLSSLDWIAGKAELGIITDGRPFAQRAKCERLGLRERVSRIVYTGDWGEEFYKPHPRAFESLEQEMGSGEDLFFYVGDNPLKDFKAPLSRGWMAIRIRRPGGLHSLLESPPECRPQLELEDLWLLPEVILKHSATTNRVQVHEILPNRSSGEHRN